MRAMQVMLNGHPRELPEGATIQDLLAREGLLGQRIAVELNFAVVPKSAYAERRLFPGDRIEIVHALGGG
ncbi:MAG: sulfur carrier protein ThiS [Lysobacterales bacterium]|jgi:sulfur carrier protein|nr:MAG: sulfur carrier protein ThiS [Xanthomonadales bacterium]